MNYDNLVQGKSGSWEVVIGMEVHAQVLANTKIFSGSVIEFGRAANSCVSEIDAAMPGMLPVLNERCIEAAVITGLALDSEISLYSRFDRKNYFYPDLPQGYQISQFYYPIVVGGKLDVVSDKGTSFSVEIERLHLEQDAGKSIHDQSVTSTLIDLNRSGAGLMEIVSKPDLRSSGQAKAFLSALRNILRYVGTCDGNMEQGSLRADVNVSVRKPGEVLGTRCEIKNLNSVRFVGKAVDYEVNRQIELIEDGNKVVQETRLFNVNSGKTISMRSKEDAHDYRYFSDPDLPPIILTQDYVDCLKQNMPELPMQKFTRYVNELNISEYDASILVADKEAAVFFENLIVGRDQVVCVKWINNELQGLMNAEGLSFSDMQLTVRQLGEVIDMVISGEVSRTSGKELLEQLLKNGGEAKKLAKELGLSQISDESVLVNLVKEIIDSNPKQVAKVKSKPNLLGWFVGQVMQKTRGKADAKRVKDLFTEELGLK